MARTCLLYSGKRCCVPVAWERTAAAVICGLPASLGVFSQQGPLNRNFSRWGSPCSPLTWHAQLFLSDGELCARLRMNDMNAGLSRREPLNVTAKPGHDLLKTYVFDVVETVRAEDRGNGRRLEAADPLLVDLLKMRHPSDRIGLHVFSPGFGRLGVVEHNFRVRDRRYVVQRILDRIPCQIGHDPEPSEKRSADALKTGAVELLLQIIPLEIDGHEGEPWRRLEFSPHEELALPGLGGGMIHLEDAYASGMGIAERESVEPGAEDHNLPNPSRDGF